MSVLRVIKPGMFTTVQDLGRPGYASIGVPIGGAADPLSLIAGNRMLGNPDGAAALEMTLLGGIFEFQGEAEIAVTGGEAELTLECPGSPRRRVESDSPSLVHEGDRLLVGPIRRGARIYLCVRGGFSVPLVLGSAATLPSAGFGGVEGRRLRIGDHIAIGPTTTRLTETHVPHPAVRDHAFLNAASPRTIRAVPGAHAELFEAAAQHAFWTGEFTIAQQSDRAGLRLSGPSILSPLGGRMPSEGMMWGAVQVPQNGSPIILMPDGPTTGGYPVIASVATVDLPALGRLCPLDRIRFARISLEQARMLFADHRAEFDRDFPPSPIPAKDHA